MNTRKQQISLRGSLANEVARRIMATPDANVTAAFQESLRASGDDIIQIPQNDTLLIGKKSEMGKFPPDW